MQCDARSSYADAAHVAQAMTGLSFAPSTHVCVMGSVTSPEVCDEDLNLSSAAADEQPSGRGDMRRWAVSHLKGAAMSHVVD